MKEVPRWDYRRTTPGQAEPTPEQQQFYEYWRREFLSGNAVDIQGNARYLNEYLSEIERQFAETLDLASLLAQLGRLLAAYGTFKTIASAASELASRAHMVLGDYDNAWEVGRPFGIDGALYIRPRCSSNSLDGVDLLRLAYGEDRPLTRVGRGYGDRVIELGTAYLTDLQSRCGGGNFVQAFCDRLRMPDLSESSVRALQTHFADGDEFQRLVDHYNEFQRGQSWMCRPRIRKLFQLPADADADQRDLDLVICGGSNIDPSVIPPRYRPYYLVLGPYVPEIVSRALELEIARLMREFENTAREDAGLPRIGEGWVRETELFHQLRDAFPMETIVHHGRPCWLRNQHLDIYFPERNVACEYQGVQHDEAVSRFGGEDGLRKQRRRDMRKRKLCEENGCTLTYVREGYDIEVVVRQISDVLKSSGSEGSRSDGP